MLIVMLEWIMYVLKRGGKGKIRRERKRDIHISMVEGGGPGKRSKNMERFINL